MLFLHFHAVERELQRHAGEVVPWDMCLARQLVECVANSSWDVYRHAAGFIAGVLDCDDELVGFKHVKNPPLLSVVDVLSP